MGLNEGNSEKFENNPKITTFYTDTILLESVFKHRTRIVINRWSYSLLLKNNVMPESVYSKIKNKKYKFIIFALRNYNFRFQENNSNLNRDSGSPRFESWSRLKCFSWKLKNGVFNSSGWTRTSSSPLVWFTWAWLSSLLKHKAKVPTVWVSCLIIKSPVSCGFILL